MEHIEGIRRLKRSLDGYFTYRRIFILITVVFGLILYLGPSLLRWLSPRKINVQDPIERCLGDRLAPLYFEAEDFNVNIQHSPLWAEENPYLSYVANGVFGVTLKLHLPMYIKFGRTLSLPVYFHPVVLLSSDTISSKEATVVHYLNGIAYRIQCFSLGLYATYQYYAHRTLPAVFVQEIKIFNPTSENVVLNVEQLKISTWPTAVSQSVTFQDGTGSSEYLVVTGSLNTPNANPEEVIAVSIVTKNMPQSLKVAAQSKVTVEILTTISYSEPLSKTDYAMKKDSIEKQAKDYMKVALQKNINKFRDQHINVWRQLWSTGLRISYSKAAGAINGDRINATMYYVLSQVRAPFYEDETTREKKVELANILSYADGCYGGLCTLQAVTLWRDLSTADDIKTVTSYWLLTLEKQGCHNLLRAGATGVIQAMVLSFGGFRFSNQHLEYNIHPKYLHRDYLFRRISYGNLTHVNVSVVVQEDNKAVLYVALDRSDKTYYACDAGCLDDPVQLGPEKKMFPVKLTEPATAILYITYDKQHMEELRHTIHVKEIAEAPAHEHHVIALHKHGHHLGGLPTFFWVSITFLIIVFHLFLFKLIYNEYCGSQDKYRSRKLSDL